MSSAILRNNILMSSLNFPQHSLRMCLLILLLVKTLLKCLNINAVINFKELSKEKKKRIY